MKEYTRKKIKKYKMVKEIVVIYQSKFQIFDYPAYTNFMVHVSVSLAVILCRHVAGWHRVMNIESWCVNITNHIPHSAHINTKTNIF